jgi:hypothetical protein
VIEPATISTIVPPPIEATTAVVAPAVEAMTIAAVVAWAIGLTAIVSAR